MPLTTPAAATVDASRQARGVALVLIFAAYENLLKTLSQSILECVAASRAKTRNLKPGVQTILIYPTFRSVIDDGGKRGWPKKYRRVLETLYNSHSKEIDVSIFPDNGKYMRSSQVEEFCEVFDLPHPGSILGKTFARIDALVTQRNSVAHGTITAEAVGRNYTTREILDLIDEWETSWLNFLAVTESTCRTPRHFLR